MSINWTLKKLCYVLTIITTILFFFQLDRVFAETAPNQVKEIDITTTPEKVLFDIANFKPGDKAIRPVMIKNSGSKDFDYILSAKKSSGSEQLYGELILTISDSSGSLYSGKLSDFSELKSRSIASNEEEELILSVEFPEHLGNEYQGLNTEVQLIFYAEGIFGGIIPGDNGLPVTATNSFNLLAIGAVLIIGGLFFHLYHRRKTQ